MWCLVHVWYSLCFSKYSLSPFVGTSCTLGRHHLRRSFASCLGMTSYKVFLETSFSTNSNSFINNRDTLDSVPLASLLWIESSSSIGLSLHQKSSLHKDSVKSSCTGNYLSFPGVLASNSAHKSITYAFLDNEEHFYCRRVSGHSLNGPIQPLFFRQFWIAFWKHHGNRWFLGIHNKFCIARFLVAEEDSIFFLFAGGLHAFCFLLDLFLLVEMTGNDIIPLGWSLTMKVAFILLLIFLILLL